MIANALEINKGLKVLDLSFNNIGSDPSNLETKHKIEEIERLKEYAKIWAELEEKWKNPKANKGKKKEEPEKKKKEKS